MKETSREESIDTGNVVEVASFVELPRSLKQVGAAAFEKTSVKELVFSEGAQVHPGVFEEKNGS